MMGLGEENAVAARARRGWLLVIDDDVLILKAIRRILGCEHDVETASSGRAAMDLLTQRGSSGYDLILCDLAMPGFSGVDVFHTLAAQMPEAAERLVFLTGGACNDDDRSFLAACGCIALQKPFDSEALRAFVRAQVA